MPCKQCGKETTILDQNSYCKTCEKLYVNEQTLICENKACQTQIKTGEAVCSGCGHSVRYELFQTSTDEQRLTTNQGVETYHQSTVQENYEGHSKGNVPIPETRNPVTSYHPNALSGTNGDSTEEQSSEEFITAESEGHEQDIVIFKLPGSSDTECDEYLSAFSNEEDRKNFKSKTKEIEIKNSGSWLGKGNEYKFIKKTYSNDRNENTTGQKENQLEHAHINAGKALQREISKFNEVLHNVENNPQNIQASNRNLSINKQSVTENHKVKVHLSKSQRERSRSTHQRITFHILVAPEFELRSKDDVVICFDRHELGGLQDTSHTLSFKRLVEAQEYRKVYRKENNVDRIYHEYEGNIQVSCFVPGQRISYMYCAVYRRKAKKTKLEYLPKQLYRSFQYNPHETDIYDGIMILQKSIEATLYTAARQAARVSIEEFFPTWKEFIVNPKQTYDRAILVMRHIWHTYNRYSENFDYEKGFMPIVRDMLFERLMHLIKDDEESTKDANIRMMAAIMVVLIIETRSMREFQMQILLQALRIRPDYDKKICADYDSLVRCFKDDPKLLDKALDNVITICKGAIAFGDPMWIYCMPLVHFYKYDVVPFQKQTQVDDKHISDSWWGIKGLAKSMQYLKDRPLSKRSFENVHANIEPMFAVDYLLQRSLVASFTLKQVTEYVSKYTLDSRIAIANVYYQMNQPWRFYNGKEISCILTSILKTSNSTDVSGDMREEQSRYVTTYKICSEVLKLLDSWYNYKMVYVEARKCALLMASRAMEYLGGIEHKMVKKELFTNGTTLLIYMSGEVKAREHTTITVWDSLYRLRLSADIRDEFYKLVAASFMKSVMGSSSISKRIEIYCEYANSYERQTQDILDHLVLKDIESFDDRANFPKTSKRYGSLLSERFDKQWLTMQNEGMSPLQICLEWKPFQNYCKILDSAPELLNERCRNTINASLDILKSQKIILKDGNITVGEFEILKIYSTAFCNIVAENDTDRHEVETLFEFRHAQCVALDKEVGAVEIILDCFKKINEKFQPIRAMSVTTDGTRDKLPESNLKRAQLKFSDFSGISSEGTVPNKGVDLFNFSEEMQDSLRFVETKDKSVVFKQMFKRHGLALFKTEKKTLQFEESSLMILQHVRPEWDKLIDRIRSLDITLGEVESYFHEIAEEDDFCKELGDMGIEKDAVSRLAGLYSQIKLSERSTRIAKAILTLSETYDLRGEFEMIKPTAEITHGRGRTLREFMTDKKYQNVSNPELAMASENECTIIEVFNSCKTVVSWIHENLGNRNMWRHFVDLSSIRAGDSAIDMAHVTCFDAAVTGYTPLIFGLKPDFGYEDVLQQCKLVWNSLKNNEDLFRQLKTVKDNLAWYKGIKENIGSNEVSSMEQVKEINEKGVYCVGFLSGTKLKIETKDVHDLANVLRLIIPHTNEKEVKTYTYDILQDMQSRLMLVAGKEKQEKDGARAIEKYIQIFDGAVRLTNVYKTLCSTGCVLFQSWKAEIHCDPKSPRCFLEFGNGLKGFQLDATQDEDVSDIIPKLAKFMETCLVKWTDYIDKERFTCPLLNYFTMDQLVILQHELVHIGRDTLPSNKVYPLLSYIKVNCNKGDILLAMKNAKKKLKYGTSQQSTNSQIPMSDCSNDKSENGPVDDHKSKLIEELIIAGISRTVAIKAVETSGYENYMDVVEWAEENETRIIEEEEEENKFKGWCERHGSIAELNEQFDTKTDSVNPTEADLERLWIMFMTSFESSVDNCISLKHLSLILECLSEDTEKIDRKFDTNSLKKGLPNLIICPGDTILKATLSIYMADMNKPFPLPEEVLLCTQHTSLDRVDIFLRRALFDSSGKIYCLVKPEELTFTVDDVCDRQMDIFIRKSKDKGIEYRFVVFTDCTASKDSRIVSALSEYRRSPVLNDQLHESIKEYIKSKLTMSETHGVTAASFDKERCCIRFVKSSRAGLGKTRLTHRIASRFVEASRNKLEDVFTTLPLQESNIESTNVAETLLKSTRPPEDDSARIFCFDIYPLVETGIDYLLFELYILGCIMDKKGYVWRRSERDLYLIETTFDEKRVVTKNTTGDNGRQMLLLFPDVWCRSPKECLESMSNEGGEMFDDNSLNKEPFKLPIQFLMKKDKIAITEKSRDDYRVGLRVLLTNCSIAHPSWAELTQFARFLDIQLKDFEQSGFCSTAADVHLPKFQEFVLKFLIQMSRDFSTRSLKISEEPYDLEVGTHIDNQLSEYQLKRTWESSPHPYIFFNPDHDSMTFLGFNINKYNMNLEDSRNSLVLENAIMTRELMRALEGNNVPIHEDFDILSREQKLIRICKVMGNELPNDPDETYELTADNAKKILAIYMRMRCDIPVVVMGETGCGKTRLVQFLCQLQLPPGVKIKCMIIMKMHGGIKPQHIISKVEEAEKNAESNAKQFGGKVYTVLFLDEANSTDCIGLVKEIMCDKSIQGRRIQISNNLRIVAACNPYRRHSDEFIKTMEEAGLGYYVNTEKSNDRFGDIPMRKLVYRVKKLPQSLIPFVWDFGQLDKDTEKLYIKQMLRKFVRRNNLSLAYVDVMTDVLSESQEFMRSQKDECSFVSLRDVERMLLVMEWFLNMSKQKDNLLLSLMDVKLEKHDGIYQQVIDENAIGTESVPTEDSSDECSYESSLQMESKPLSRNSSIESVASFNTAVDSEENIFHNDSKQVTRKCNAKEVFKLDNVTRSIVLALGVCYHSSLRHSREKYRKMIFKCFKDPCNLPGKHVQFEAETKACQEVFLDNVTIDGKIAKNTALRENVFMMAIAIELRIPLFIVGKPGSSKSLAKTVVADAMRGTSGENIFFSKLKQAQLVSYQCSPLATAESIIALFRQCAQFQQKKDLRGYVAVVVLDEVGLAEDSPTMPLKTLHPLLETGYQIELDEPDMHDAGAIDEEHNKVGFIGISNWSLDPAKMNRGMMVQRDVPNSKELEEIARGICESNIKYNVEHLHEPLANAYNEIITMEGIKREFFGLRDFYSLLKMLQSEVESNKVELSERQIKYAILRNFGGLDAIDPYRIFTKHIRKDTSDMSQAVESEYTQAEMIQHCLLTASDATGQGRFLLLLTDNLIMATLLQQKIFKMESANVIYGSSFPSDLDFTQVCRQINKIKVCMESGNTVILLNLENIYESLYDALNQYYTTFSGYRFVDIGLGTHRVKCKVHKNFRLIVVAEKTAVYERFPIPLINRLEKHLIKIDTLLTEQQLLVSQRLKEWAEDFCKQRTPKNPERENKTKLSDVFCGYHNDATASIVLHQWQHNIADGNKHKELVFENGKNILLWCAIPESIVRLKACFLPDEEVRKLSTVYWTDQAHGSLSEYIRYHVEQRRKNEYSNLLQVTTHSPLLSTSDKVELAQKTGVQPDFVILEHLQSFDTEQQFVLKIRTNIDRCHGKDQRTLLIVMCDYSESSEKLIACARNCLAEECLPYIKNKANLFVVLLVRLFRDGSLTKGRGFTGFQCGNWHCAHIDTIRGTVMPPFQMMFDTSIGQLLTQICKSDANGESEDTSVYSSMAAITFMKTLIINCVPAAMAKVKDHLGNDPGRTCKRIEMMERLLTSADNNLSFLRCLSRMLSSLMTAAEEKYGNMEELPQWLYNLSKKEEDILNAGTLRAACMQYIERRTAVILADATAYIDRNDNLDILDGNSEIWLKEFWLNMLSIDVLALHIRDMICSGSANMQSEITVRTSGFEGQPFSNKLPFSWSLSEIFEISRQSQTDVASVGYALGEMKIGDILSRYETQGDTFISLYLEDVVKMNTITTCNTEIQVICKVILKKAEEIWKTESKMTLLFKLLHIHQTARRSTYLFTTLRSANYCITTIFKEDTESFFVQLRSGIESSSGYVVENMMGVLFKLIMEKLTPNNSEVDTVFNKRQGQHDFLRRLYTCRPIIEKILSNYDETNDGHKKGRGQWTRLMIIKLFIEHVRLPETIQGNRLRQNAHLWNNLGEQVSIKELSTLTEIEKFLKQCNQMMLKCLFGNFDKCGKCKKSRKDIQSMVMLECQHIICSVCFDTGRSTGIANECPHCRSTIDPQYDPHSSKSGEGNMKDLKAFQLRCNSFYMAVIKELCFSGNEAPSDEVLSHLLFQHVTREQNTKSETRIPLIQNIDIFVDSVNTTPVFKSVMLKLLVRLRESFVVQHLDDYISNSRQLLEENAKLETNENRQITEANPGSRSDEQSEPNTSSQMSSSTVEANENVAKSKTEIYQGLISQHLMQLYVMVVQCFEDRLHEEAVIHNEIDYAKECLQTAPGRQTDMSMLYTLANIRYGLAVLAKYIHTGSIDDKYRSMLDSFIDAGLKVIVRENQMPRIYLLKQIFRVYGFQSLKQLCLTSDDVLSDFASNLGIKASDEQDVYVIFGEKYRFYREALFNTYTHQESWHMTGVSCRDKHEHVLLSLASHREVMMHASENEHDEEHHKVTVAVESYLKDQQLIHSILSRILINDLAVNCKDLKVDQGMDKRENNVHCFIVHCMCVFTILDKPFGIVQPLIELMVEPSKFEDSYLPAMPYVDNTLLEEVKSALDEFQANDRYLNHKWYSCPNGHPYSIGNCGNVNQAGVCYDCGAKIGRNSELKGRVKLYEDNEIGVSKQVGHTMGAADAITSEAVREDLPYVVIAMIRLLTHTSLYLGANKNASVVNSLISKGSINGDVGSFLYKHIKRDLTCIGNSLNKSADEVFILMHVVVQSMLDIADVGYQFRKDDCCFKEAATRALWERDISDRLLQPTLRDIDAVVKDGLEKIGSDKRLAADGKFNEILEIGEQECWTQEPQNVMGNPALWQFKSRISVEDMRNKFNFSQTGANKQCSVLAYFLERNHILRAMKYVPNIKTLQKLLLRRYNKNLDRKQADSTTIEALVLDDTSEAPYASLVDEFITAWEICRKDLNTYVCLTKHGNGSCGIPETMCCSEITLKTPLSWLLPSQRGNGLCSYALLQFLLRQHNDMIEFVRSHQTVPPVQDVGMNDVNASDLIIYDTEGDLLPIVLANCQYSLEISKRTTVEYDFASIERQIIERFLCAKPTVRFSEQDLNQADEMIYRFDSTNCETLQSLGHMIKQENIADVTKNQIEKELKHVADILQTIHNVNITLNILRSLGGRSPDESLSAFMENVLKLKNPICSMKASQYCRLKHIRSLWLLLFRKKAMESVLREQTVENVFDGIAESDVFVPLEKEQEQALSKYYSSISEESLTLLSEIIFECIVTYMSGESATGKHSMSEILGIYYFDQIPQLEVILKTFPSEVIGHQSAICCVRAFRALQDRLKYTVKRSKFGKALR